MSIDQISQSEILVRVEFYDEQEKAKLLQYPADAVAAMKRLVAKPIAVPTSEFFTYFLFHRMARGLAGYDSVDQIRLDLSRATTYIDSCIEFDGSSIRVPSASAQLPTEIIEHVGEAVGLAVASRIHGLTEADWVRLPVKKRPNNKKLLPSFDFQAADSKTLVQCEPLIQVETKGSAVGDNSKKSSKVSKHKADILAKKEKLDNPSAGEQDPYPAAVRYGTITALDAGPNDMVRCWLVDPEPENDEWEPRRFKLMARMRFLSRWISIVSPRSQLASAIATRVNDMAKITNPFELDGIPLLRGNGESFSYPVSSLLSPHSTFFSNKARVTDGPAGGIAVQIRPNMLAFLGVRQDLVDMAASQRFDDVLSYEAPAGTLKKSVEFVFHENKFKTMQLPRAIAESATRSGSYRRFTLEGSTQYNRSGLVFGFFSLDA